MDNGVKPVDKRLFPLVLKMKPPAIPIDSYTYDLPSGQIAAFPLPQRDASRLLVWKDGQIDEHRFHDLSHFLPHRARMVLNNTRVIEARLFFQKETGGTIEIFCLEPWGAPIEKAMVQEARATWRCLIGGASKWKPGLVLHKKAGESIDLNARYIGKDGEAFLIELSWTPAHLPFAAVLHAAGAMPLPPYIKRKAEELDDERYQTIFSRYEGSVAAPTAALHFTDAVFDSLAQKNIHTSFITLHVGAGTFKPVKAATIDAHSMHSEPFTISRHTLEELVAAEKIIAVGTTSLRTLESLYWLGIRVKKGFVDNALQQWEAYELETEAEGIGYKESYGYLVNYLKNSGEVALHCRTALLIVPGYRFRVAEGLVTNFHQPQSTLLLLVAAFVGEDWKKIYDYALHNGFRFLSYGDSSLLWRKEINAPRTGEAQL